MSETESSARKTAPANRRKYRSVQWRIIAWQLPLSFVLLVGLLFWLENHLKNAFYSTNFESIQRLSQMVVSQVQTSMESKKEGRLWDRVERLLPPDKATRLRIINKQGVEVFSSEPETRGKTHNLTDPICVPCHVEGSANIHVRSKFIDSPSGDPYTVFVAPLRNTEDCSPCHKGEGEMLGMVYVSHSLEPVHRLIRTIQIGLIIAGAFALFFTILTTRFFLGRYLNKPLRQLVAGARAIGHGRHPNP